MKRVVQSAVATLLFCAGSTAAALAQTQPRPEPEEVAQLVESLSWNSVAEECNWFWNVHVVGETAGRLIAIGRPASNELIRALRDPERAVAAHLVLCAIWSVEAKEQCTGVIDDVHGTPFHYQFGQMKFTSDTRTNNSLDPRMLEAVEQSWKRLLESHLRKAAA
jgi:hypothetical protein